MFSSSNYRAVLEFRVCLCLCSYTLQIRSRHSLHFSNCLSSLSPSHRLSVHFPAGETSVIRKPGIDIVAVWNSDCRQALITHQTFQWMPTDSLNSMWCFVENALHCHQVDKRGRKQFFRGGEMSKGMYEPVCPSVCNVPHTVWKHTVHLGGLPQKD